jgi:CubicO group peptidase (beta-lactamase class C family)
MAYGYYPTLGEMVRVARLYQNGGKWGERQILYGARIQELLAGAKPKGLPTGEKLSGGQVTYTNAFWVAPSPSSSACRRFYPRMVGWGGNLVALLPGGLTGIRLAKADESSNPAVDDTDGMARVAERLASGCR